MNGFDVILLMVVITFGIIGALRGFVREIMSFVNWIAASVIAWVFADNVANFFARWFIQLELRLVAAFVALFAIVFIIGLIATYFMHRVVSAKRGFRISNIALGSAVGVARGVLVLVLVALLAGLTVLPQRNWWREAFLVPYVERIALVAASFLPKDIARHIRYG
jgi:membrane protein required for colicin V production